MDFVTLGDSEKQTVHFPIREINAVEAYDTLHLNPHEFEIAMEFAIASD